VTISNFTTKPGSDFDGLPTNLMYMDLIGHWRVNNKNPTFPLYFNGGIAQLGSGSIPVLSQGGVSPFSSSSSSSSL